MGRHAMKNTPVLNVTYFRNGERERKNVSYNEMEITSPVLAKLMLEVRNRLEKQIESMQEDAGGGAWFSNKPIGSGMIFLSLFIQADLSFFYVYRIIEDERLCRGRTLMEGVSWLLKERRKQQKKK